PAATVADLTHAGPGRLVGGVQLDDVLGEDDGGGGLPHPVRGGQRNCPYRSRVCARQAGGTALPSRPPGRTARGSRPTTPPRAAHRLVTARKLPECPSGQPAPAGRAPAASPARHDALDSAPLPLPPSTRRGRIHAYTSKPCPLKLCPREPAPDATGG